ncbi:MAG: hypothetical protein WD315_03360 [Balneolaceae bacterium]
MQPAILLIPSKPLQPQYVKDLPVWKIHSKTAFQQRENHPAFKAVSHRIPLGKIRYFTVTKKQLVPLKKEKDLSNFLTIGTF